MRYYTLNGHTPVPVDSLEGWRFQPIEERRVAEDVVGDARVSTVFLAFDHAFDGPPLLFETMIFASGGQASDLDQYQERYATWDEAEAGHARAVALVQGETALD